MICSGNGGDFNKNKEETDEDGSPELLPWNSSQSLGTGAAPLSQQ